MPRFDLSPAELRKHRPEITETDDFDAFWQCPTADSRCREPTPTRAVVIDYAFNQREGGRGAHWLVQDGWLGEQRR